MLIYFNEDLNCVTVQLQLQRGGRSVNQGGHIIKCGRYISWPNHRKRLTRLLDKQKDSCLNHYVMNMYEKLKSIVIYKVQYGKIIEYPNQQDNDHWLLEPETKNSKKYFNFL